MWMGSKSTLVSKSPAICYDFIFVLIVAIIQKIQIFNVDEEYYIKLMDKVNA